MDEALETDPGLLTAEEWPKNNRLFINFDFIS